MPRQLNGPYAAVKEVERVVLPPEGGSGVTTAYEAAAGLKLVARSMLDTPNGFAVYDQDGKYLERYFKSLQELGFGDFSLIGPRKVVVGTTVEYVISNFDSFTNIEVSANIGTVVKTGDKLAYTAPAQAGLLQLNLSGRIIEIQVVEPYIEAPTVVYPAPNSVGVPDIFTIKLARLATLPEVKSPYVAAQDGTVNIPDNAFAVYLKGKNSETSDLSVTIDGEKYLFPDLEVTQLVKFAFGTGSKTMLIENLGTGSLEYAFVTPNDVHVSTSYQVAKDAEFTRIVTDVSHSTENLLSLAQDLTTGTQYYLRARFHGTNYGDSAWSEPVAFVTASVGYPGKEYAVPTYASGTLNRSLVYHNSNYSALSGDGNYFAVLGTYDGTHALFIYKKDANDGWVLSQVKPSLGKYTLGTPITFGDVSISNDGSMICVGLPSQGKLGNVNLYHGTIYLFKRDGSGNYNQTDSRVTGNSLAGYGEAYSGNFRAAISKNGLTVAYVGIQRAESSGDDKYGLQVYAINSAGVIDGVALFPTIDSLFTDALTGIRFNTTGSRMVVTTSSSIRVYRRTTGTYILEQQIPFTSGNHCPIALSSEGSRMAAVGNANITIFRLSNNVWTIETVLAVPDTAVATDDLANRRVDINADGTRVVVGVPDAVRDGFANCGTAYIYVYETGNWKIKKELAPVINGRSAGLNFGANVNLSGDGTYAAVSVFSTPSFNSYSGYLNWTSMFRYQAEQGDPGTNGTLLFNTVGVHTFTAPMDGNYEFYGVAPGGGGGGGGATSGGNYNFQATGGGGGGSGGEEGTANIYLSYGDKVVITIGDGGDGGAPGSGDGYGQIGKAGGTLLVTKTDGTQVLYLLGGLPGQGGNGSPWSGSRHGVGGIGHGGNNGGYGGSRYSGPGGGDYIASVAATGLNIYPVIGLGAAWWDTPGGPGGGSTLGNGGKPYNSGAATILPTNGGGGQGGMGGFNAGTKGTKGAVGALRIRY